MYDSYVDYFFLQESVAYPDPAMAIAEVLAMQKASRKPENPSVHQMPLKQYMVS